MPRSMTAFSRQSSQHDWGNITWEIRSVNHRHLELDLRLPETVRELEMNLREQARKQLHRGKVGCYLQLQLENNSQSVDLNLDLAKRYVDASQQIATLMTDPAQVSPLDVLRHPGVLREPEVDADALKKAVTDLFNQALQQLGSVREREGEKLQAMVEQRLDSIQSEVDTVRTRLPELMAAQRQKILDKLAELKGDIDNDRVEQELVHLAQKADVDEELDRLEAHLGEIRHILTKPGQIGRRLDFLMQELNREANTLSSKSNATSTTNSAVELKVLIEQMREQIQNIE
ncbi:YicC/YloC family endoribonuclease [Porticoccus sp. W117]|uniref:YicC/YloC family endoribonuclease n=1 Tax=Porticoccus sp. W117 TaxID=3054777 RepID=UPI00259444AF|nr:YicC/YloC family endoribonuclease [Porticoccus sp. W117]MDM3870533.1 YicC/YloC family endoribonuclease [Porticoccus sp. W117]